MRRRFAVAASLLVLALIPGAAANPAPPTLTGSKRGPLTDLSWSAPAGTNVDHWTLFRTSTSGDLDLEQDLESTSFTDHAPPPGETFSYRVTYTNGDGEESDPSNLYVRQWCDPVTFQHQDISPDSVQVNGQCAKQTVCILPLGICPWT